MGLGCSSPWSIPVSKNGGDSDYRWGADTDPNAEPGMVPVDLSPEGHRSWLSEGADIPR